MFMIDLVRPKILVELGTYTGVSYSAFCQAVKKLGIDTRCYGIDTWEGDPQTGFYGTDVLTDLRDHHDPLYGSFSRLIQSTFDEAAKYFSNGSIDLLHLDGLHTYEAVRHDFETWLPKLSQRAVILLHDTNVRERDFGVWKLWEELSGRYPSFSMTHGHGLGVLQVGKKCPEALNLLFGMRENEIEGFRELFHQLGSKLEVQIEKEQAVRALSAQVAEKEQRVQALSASVAALNTSRAWKMALLFRRIREVWLPAGTRRNKSLELTYRSFGVLRKQGPLVLLGKIKNRFVGQSQKLNRPPIDYQTWILENEPHEAELMEQQKSSKRFSYRPLISILAPVYNTPDDILRATIQSVVNQTYDKWELCLVDGHSEGPGVKEVLNKWARIDKRVRTKFLNQNLGISGNSNEALAMANGDFVALLDHDDLLAPFALFEVVKFLNKTSDCDMVYSDEDQIDSDGKRHTYFFKPDWSPDLLQCLMYTGHLSVYRRELIQSLDGFRSAFDLSQDYDLALRVTEKTTRIGHIPKVLYHWRTLPGSAAAGGKPYARISNLAALSSALSRRGYNAQVLEYPNANRVKFKPKECRSISIIVPTDSKQNILACLSALLAKTDYENFEVLVVTNHDLAKHIAKKYAGNPCVRTAVFDGPFNFSAKCNLGARQSTAEFLLFLNDDVQPLDPHWLEWLAGYFEQEGVGAVSPKMLYQDNTIQHAGMVTGVRGFIGTAFHAQPKDSGIYFGLAQCTRTVSALSAACLLIRKKVFDGVGGFDERNTPVAHSDFDLCFKIREAGFRLVYTPFTTMRHRGHVSVGEAERHGYKPSEKVDLFLLRRWGALVSYDPYYTDNMRDFLYFDSPVKYRMYAKNNAHVEPRGADILFVSHDLSLSGAPIITNTLASYLSAEYFVTVISPSDGKLREAYEKQDIPVIIDPLVMDSPESLRDLLANYDMVVTSTVFPWRIVRLAKSMGKPVLWFIHESDAGVRHVLDNPGAQLALTEADEVIFPAHETQMKYHAWSRNGNHTTLYYGIQPDNQDRLNRPKSLSNTIHVVHVGTIEPRKGQDTLVKAVKRLPETMRNDFQFYFVGRSLSDRAFHQTLLEATSAELNIHWIGEVSHEQAIGYIRDCDIFVCTSRDETGPIVVMEAMACGKSIISTQVGSVGEVIQHDVNGILIPIGDDEALASALMRLHDDQPLRERNGAEAARTFRERFALERYGGDVKTILSSVLASSS